MAATTEVIRNRGAGDGGGDCPPRTLEERAVTGSQSQERHVGPAPYRHVKVGKEGPPKQGQIHTRDGKTRDAAFEKKHPRAARGRTGGGRFVQSGGDANTVQTRLGIKSTGKMDKTTEAAVRRYQARHGLVVDGKVGHQTISAMRGDKNASNVEVGPLTKQDRDWLAHLAVRQKGKRGNTKLSEASLVEHAREELTRAGLFGKDSDYEGMLGPAVMKVVEAFSGQGHSGGSAAISLELIEKLLRYEPLTPISSDPEEWEDRSEVSGYPFWQNKRNSKAFSRDGGKTWELLEATFELAHAMLQLEEAEKHHKLKCPKCDTVQSASNKTCTKCGHNLSGARKAKFAELDEVVEIRRVRGHAVRACELEAPELAEALMDGARELEELRGSFDPNLHPRDREGQFRDVLGNLQRYIDLQQDLDAVDTAIRAIPERGKMHRDERSRMEADERAYWEKFSAIKGEVTTEFEKSLRDHGSTQSIHDHSVENNIYNATRARAKEAGLVQPPRPPSNMRSNVTPFDRGALDRSVTRGLDIASRYSGGRGPNVPDELYLKHARDELRKLAKEAKGRRPKRRAEREALGGGQMELPVDKANAELRKRAAEWQSDWERKMARVRAREEGSESEREQIVRKSPTAAAEEREHQEVQRGSLERGAEQAALQSKDISSLAQMIRRDWAKPSVGAVPYLDAMRTMMRADDPYLQDPGHEVIQRFLSNSSGWRGPTAKAIKAELRRRLQEAELPIRRVAIAARDARASGDLELAERYERRANTLAEAAGMEAFFKTTGKPRAGDGRFRETMPTKPGKAITQEQIARTHVSEDERRREQERELEQETTPPEGSARPTMAASAA